MTRRRIQFTVEISPDDAADLSDRLVAILGPDVVLSIGAAIARAGGSGGVAAGLARLRQAAEELTDLRKAQAAAEAESAAGQPLSFADVVRLMSEVAEVDVFALGADAVARAFSPAMGQWKRDVLDHVLIGEKSARGEYLSPAERNEIVWTVASTVGFFPWPLG